MKSAYQRYRRNSGSLATCRLFPYPINTISDNEEKLLSVAPANAEAFSRDAHDDESALRSDWGSDESICESIGDGQPRDDLDEHREELQARDDQERLLIDESGARTPDSPRVLAQTLNIAPIDARIG